MDTFQVVHAVDFSSGVAIIGKCHCVSKNEEIWHEDMAKCVGVAREKSAGSEEK